MDFVTDSLVTGRRLRALAIVDDYSRECPVIEADTSLAGLGWYRYWSAWLRAVGYQK